MSGHILVTGGAGYIGSHCVLVLLEAGYKVTVIDNLVNSSKASLERVSTLAGGKTAHFEQVDLCDKDGLEKVFAATKFDAVIHFAALKAVGESTQIPLKYYENNITGTLNLMDCMERHDCRRIIFSSSATVYGTAPVPYNEGSQTGVGITHSYGRTKFMIEEILKDYHKCPKGKEWSIALLRYFNPIGAHPSGMIGEDPNGIPNNLMPYVVQVAVGRRPHVNVFGNDYPTKDGTGVRDYIHVMDLAEGHVAMLAHMEKRDPELYIYNLGSGVGLSVMEMIKGMEAACGKEIPYQIGPRREGDLPAFWADPAKAADELKWKVKRGLKEMCDDLWKWQSQNPNGYAA
eukprot:Sspe_Gene.13020::Locus_4462_Transcript_1_1_Confidence_1.000_Length_1106::g.13020::m.13020/K01784/galE, GALE; UDP-glucose 4-epimerase